MTLRPRRLDTSGPEAERWDAFVAARPDSHILQSSRWGQFKAAFGWQAACVAIEDEGRLVGGAQVLFRSLAPGLTVAYVPKGPVVDWADEETVEALLTALHDLVSKKQAILLKIEPDLPDEPANVEMLRAYGFRSSPQTVQPRSTILLDLTADEQTILAGMKSKTRYNVRLAARKEVVVREGMTDDLELFYHLMQLTGQRDDFGVHSRAYYEEAYRRFVPAGLARLFLADYQGRTLAALMAFAFGRRAWYLYGASSDEERQRMPNHLLQWEAIRWAKGRGCCLYDLWGIPDEVGANPQLYQSTQTRSGGLWGVYRFKQGFGGRVARYVGAYDYPYSPALYWIYNKVMTRRASPKPGASAGPGT